MTLRWRKSSRSDGVNDHACVEVAQVTEDGEEPQR
jgi:uncharacterized protein DUF397